jgi:hypothetical protein
VTHAILSRTDSFALKLNIIMDVARVHADERPIGQALLTVEPSIRAVLTLRNKLAHGIYGVSETGLTS